MNIINNIMKFDEFIKITENNENDINKKYYAIYNMHGDYGEGFPIYTITDTKEEMIETLNRYIKEMMPEDEIFSYSIEDLDEDVRIYGKNILDSYISDDWVYVTDKKDIFEKIKENVEESLGKKAVLYV